MITITESATRIRIFGAYDEIQTVILHFRFRPESYWRAPSYQIWKTTNGAQGWDGYLSPVQRIDATSAKANRGWLSGVVSFCQSQFEVNTEKLLDRPFKGLVPDDVPGDIITAPFELDEHQKRCVCAWLVHGIGMNHMTVSAGKTATFCAAAAMVKQQDPEARVLYFAQSERLANQVFAEASKFLPTWRISQYGGGKHDKTGKDMVVATAAMINKHFKELVREKWTLSFTVLAVDEAQHSVSPSMKKILLAIPAFYRFGASDTVHAENLSKQYDMIGMVGPILEKVAAAPLISIGRIARPDIYVIDQRHWRGKYSHLTSTPETGSEAWALVKGVWQHGTYLGPVYEADPNPESEDGILLDKEGEPVKVANLHHLLLPGPDGKPAEFEVESRWCLLQRMYDQAIIMFKERNQLIAQWAKHYSDKGFPTLVVATRTLHVYILQAAISKLISPERVRVLFSYHATKERDEAFEWFKATPGSVLISPLVKEGVSIPEIRAGVIADYVANYEVLNQMIGRMIRRKSTGDNVGQIAMFIERQHPTYMRGSTSVVKGIEKIRGYNFRYPCAGPETALTAPLIPAVGPYSS